jgi:lipopolysaccharide export system protein LptA
MTIRAERVEVRETSDGYRVAQASGGAGRPASYRQRREGSRGGADEAVEGEAERIDYDQKADTLRFAGNAQVRRLRGGVIADEINGNEITWNAQAETLNVQGGAATPANPGGRVRVVLSPRESAASAAKPAPAPAAPLKPSTTLGPAK